MTSSLYAQGRRALVIHEDDVGMTHGSNVAFRELSERGVISSGSVMAPCPWFPETLEIAASNPRFDLGVHLTLNSEMRPMKWRPLTRPPKSAGLTDEFGYFWPERQRGWRPEPEAVEAELRAQIDAAIAGGVDVTHLDTHCGAVMRPKLLPIYRRLGEDYDLPIVLMRRVEGGNPRPPGTAMWREFEQALDAADACGDPVFDLFFETPWDRTVDAESVYSEAIANVPEGITFFAFHFSAPGDVEAAGPRALSHGRIRPLQLRQDRASTCQTRCHADRNARGSRPQTHAAGRGLTLAPPLSQRS